MSCLVNGITSSDVKATGQMILETTSHEQQPVALALCFSIKIRACVIKMQRALSLLTFALSFKNPACFFSQFKNPLHIFPLDTSPNPKQLFLSSPRLCFHSAHSTQTF